MPDQRISELTAAGALTGAEMIPLVQSGATCRASFSTVQNTVVEAVEAHAFTATGGTTSATLADRFGDALNIQNDFGALGNGVADDTAAFLAAALSGKFVVVPRGSGSYLITTFMNFASNTQLVGVGSPTIRSTTIARSIRCNTVSNVLIEGIIFDGNKAAVSVGNLGTIQNACDGVVIRDCTFTNPAASLALTAGSTRCEVSDCRFTDSGAGAIELSSCNGNKILRNDIQGGVGFGVHLYGTSSYNHVHGNRTTSNGLELVGLTTDCQCNRITENHAEGTGDNGISISGRRNVVSGNICKGNAFNGISFFGDENIAFGNVCMNNGQAGGGTVYSGIRIHGGFGWRGYWNIVSDNLCGDDQAIATQKNGVRCNGSQYVIWGTGLAISPADPWRYHGLNFYKATGTGTTGATAPVHTSGIVSDGGVSWQYYGTFDINTSPRYNKISGTRGQGNTLLLEDVAYSNRHDTNDKIRLATDDAVEAYQEIHAGTGTPDSVVTANPGAFYIRYNPAGAFLTCYTKGFGTGNTGWRLLAQRLFGSTAGRPVPIAAEVGVEFFDTTIGKPIWWNGTIWVDATGVAA
jgi:parallel beta-helix repeat protein